LAAGGQAAEPRSRWALLSLGKLFRLPHFSQANRKQELRMRTGRKCEGVESWEEEAISIQEAGSMGGLGHWGSIAQELGRAVVSLFVKAGPGVGQFRETWSFAQAFQQLVGGRRTVLQRCLPPSPWNL
jgi:hypothetical protein